MAEHYILSSKNELMKLAGILFTYLFLTPFVNAQSQLRVNCYPNESYYNMIMIDSNLIEYATCSMDPSFYVAVIDPSTCSAWGTNYNGANPDHAFGNSNQGSCRPRVEYFFAFRMDDATELAGMTNMLQQIPNGHSIVIYTPISYNYATVNATNSNLISELENRWDPSIIQGNDIMVLYGVQGNSASYVEDITQITDQQTGDHISFTTTVCNTASIQENEEVFDLLVKQDGLNLILDPSVQLDELKIFNALGKEVAYKRIENVIQLQQIGSGIYLFQGVVEGKTMRSKQFLQY